MPGMAEMQSAWLATARSAIDRLTLEIAGCEIDQISQALAKPLSSIEPAPDVVHRPALASVLLDAGRTIVETLHAARPTDSCGCRAFCWSRTSAFTAWDHHDPRDAFAEWTRAFVSYFEREHPPAPVVKAAALIRTDPSAAWTIERLSSQLTVGRARLRADFVASFDVKLSSYVQLVRATHALRLLRTAAKVEAIAWDVGYRSKKDLYAALTRWVGATPTELRELSDDERDWLECELRIRCVHGRTGLNVICGALASSDMSAFHRPRPRRQSTPRRHR